MKKRPIQIVAVLILIVGLIAAWYTFFNKPDTSEKIMGGDLKNPSVKVAAWNLQVFGPSKANNSELMSAYADRIRDYDIVFVQEIRDSTNTSFLTLCYMLADYDCIGSSRAGRTSSKEQYGVIYKKDLPLINYTDYNPDAQDRWERPPFQVTFDFGEYNMTLFVLHAKPADVKDELMNLEKVEIIANASGNVVVLGDLNADCSYYNPVKDNEFDGWNWIIQDTDDTTVSATDCAYDRIILNDGAKSHYVEHGIDQRVTSNMSDHYIVWFAVAR